MRLSQFKIKLTKHLWSIALSDNEQPEHKWSFQSSDDDIVKLDSIKLFYFFGTKTGITNFGLGLGWSLSIEQVYILNFYIIYIII